MKRWALEIWAGLTLLVLIPLALWDLFRDSGYGYEAMAVLLLLAFVVLARVLPSRTYIPCRGNNQCETTWSR